MQNWSVRCHVPVDDGNLRASLLARFVLAESPCPRYTKREMDRVRHPRTPTGPNCVINRLVQMSDKAPSAAINHNLRLCAANRTWDVLRKYGFWFLVLVLLLFFGCNVGASATLGLDALEALNNQIVRYVRSRRMSVLFPR